MKTQALRMALLAAPLLLAGCDRDGAGSSGEMPSPLQTITRFALDLLGMTSGSACDSAQPVDVNQAAVVDDQTVVDANSLSVPCP